MDMFDRYYTDADFQKLVLDRMYSATASIWSVEGGHVARSTIDSTLTDYFNVKSVDELIYDLYAAGVDFDDKSLLDDYDAILDAITSRLEGLRHEPPEDPDEWPAYVLAEW